MISNHIKHIVFNFTLLLLGLIYMQSSFAAEFISRSIDFHDKNYTYVIYKPSELKSNDKLPVILFLHGSGESGHDGKKLINTGIGEAIKNHPNLYQAIVVMPQIPEEERTYAIQQGDDGNIYWNKLESQQLAIAVFNSVLNEFSSVIDERRLYLTGVSMGGSGTWRLAAGHPHLFTAIVPIAACQQIGHTHINQLTNLPIWVFHGDRDELCPVFNGREIVNAIKQAGGNVQLTEYPTADHPLTWKKAYADDALVKWLFQQSK